MLTRFRSRAAEQPESEHTTPAISPERPTVPLDEADAPDQLERVAEPEVPSTGSDGSTRGPTLRLLLHRDHGTVQRVVPLQQTTTSIGTDMHDTIQIESPHIEGTIAEIVLDGRGERADDGAAHQAARLVARSDKFPIYFKGQRVREQTLHVGDELLVGDARAPLATLIYEDHGHLEVGDARVSGQRIDLSSTTDMMLGRAHDNQIVLDHPRVSAHHARITRTPRGDYALTDLASTNGTYVNGLRVNRTRLMPGAEIRIGPYRFIFTGDELVQYDETTSVRIDAGSLTERVHHGFLHRKTKVLLNNVSLSILPGSFVAIIGASGAGKSTLMNALNGQRPANEGVVLYNGEDLYEHMGEFAGAMGYVPQDDIIHKDLTVERAFYYAARMRLPKDYTRKQIKQRINEVLDDIEMLGSRHQMVSSLSGGQRKRVSIGVELLAKPAVFFLDEPTSGLDPGLDRAIMQMLRRLSDRGHTVILSTHTTSDVDNCDFVAFVAQGGRLAFYGPPVEMKQYFETNDYADIFNMVHSDPDTWVARFQQSPEFLQYIVSPQVQAQSLAVAERRRAQAKRQLPSQPGGLRQFGLLTRRYIEILSHDLTNLLILLAQAPIIGVLTVLLAEKNIVYNVSLPTDLANPQDIYSQRALFIMAASAIWFGIINAAREIVKEDAIYRRERSVHLGILPYVMSKVVVLGALSAIQSFILLEIVGWRTGFSAHGIYWHSANAAFWEEFGALFLMSLVGVTMGLLVSALAPNSDRAISIVPIVLLPQIIFANVIFTLKGYGNWVSYIVPARWGMQALGSITRLRNHFTDHSHGAFYHSDPEHVLGYCGALAGLGVLCLLLTFYFQWRKDIYRHQHGRT